MSTWNKKLWGAEPKRTPVSEAAKRCARIRAGGSAEITPPLIVGVFAGQVLFVVAFILSLVTTLGTNPLMVLVAFGGWGWLVVAATVLAIVTFGGRIERIAHDWRQRKGISREGLVRQRRGRKGIWQVWGMVGLGAGVFAVAGSVFLSDPTFGLVVLGETLCITGFPIVSVGLFGRKGSKLVCARCSYPMSTWRGAQHKCPECGNDWKSSWGARFGVRAIRGRLVGIGTGMVASSAAILMVVRGFA